MTGEARREAHEPTAEDMRLLRLAIADPGSFVGRVRRDGHPELPAHWAARAVVALGWRPTGAPR